MGASLGETVNANILAGGLVLVPPMLIGWLLGLWRDLPTRPAAWLARIATTAGLLVLVGWMGTVLWTTQSRGAWMATAAALGTLLVMRWTWLRWPALVLAVAFAVWLAVVGPVTVLTPVMQGGMAHDYNGRMEIYARSAGLLARHPLTGIGLGAFDRAIIEDAPQVYEPLTPGLPHAHNIWLQVGLDLGLPGVSPIRGCSSGSAWLFWQTWRRRNHHAHGGLALAGMGGLVALTVHGLVDAPLWNSKLAFLPWLIFALAVLLSLSFRSYSSTNGNHTRTGSTNRRRLSTSLVGSVSTKSGSNISAQTLSPFPLTDLRATARLSASLRRSPPPRWVGCGQWGALCQRRSNAEPYRACVWTERLPQLLMVAATWVGGSPITFSDTIPSSLVSGTAAV